MARIVRAMDVRASFWPVLEAGKYLPRENITTGRPGSWQSLFFGVSFGSPASSANTFQPPAEQPPDFHTNKYVLTRLHRAGCGGFGRASLSSEWANTLTRACVALATFSRAAGIVRGAKLFVDHGC